MASQHHCLDELRHDLEELKKLHDQAERPRVKDILSMDIWKLTAEITEKQEKQVQDEAEEKQHQRETGDGANETEKPAVKTHRYTKEINTYAWDQSDKFMKIYVTLNGVQNLQKENVTSEYTERSFRLRVSDLDNKDYSVYVTTLAENIVPAASYHKVKKDMVAIMLKKVEEKKTWAHVKESQAKARERKTPKMDEKKDPNEGLMDMMKQMYDDGDDEMKRTISKAWYESHQKKGKGEDMEL